MKDLLEDLLEFENLIDKIDNQKVAIDYSKLNEYTLPWGQISEIEGAKKIIYAFQDHLINYGINMYPLKLINKLQENINFIRKTLATNTIDDYTASIYEGAIEDGIDVLSHITTYM